MFDISLCRYKDLNELVRFLEDTWEQNIYKIGSLDKIYFLRRYRRYKDNYNLNILVIKYSNKIVGFNGFMPFKAIFGKKIVCGILEGDIFICPSLRRRYPLLFSRFYFYLRKLFAYHKNLIIVSPHNEIIMRKFRDLGYKKFVDVSSLIAPFDVIENGGVGVSTNVIIKPLNFFKDSINDFYKRIKSQYDFLILADADYLNWRYINNPYQKYQVYIVYNKNKKILGYIVMKIETLKAYIVEMVFDINFLETLPFSIYRVLKFYKNGVKFIFCSNGSEKYTSILESIGFSPYKKKILMILRNKIVNNQLFSKKNIYLNRLSIDLS